MTAASAGDTILVTNGVYQTGSLSIDGYVGNRVVLNKAMTVQSVNGPSATLILGQGPLGAGAVSCAYLVNGAVLSGFTLTNGFSNTSGSTEMALSGGGALLYYGGIVFNCVISGNSVYGDNLDSYYSAAQGGAGGGVYCSSGGLLQGCMIRGNRAAGGFNASHWLSSYWNESYYVYTDCYGYALGGRGGGVHCSSGGTLQNCTLSGNQVYNEFSVGGSNYASDGFGGGLYCSGGGTMENCIVYGNTGSTGPNWSDSGSGMSYRYSCTWPSRAGTGNITNTPQFVSAGTADFRLQAISPCINAGTNQTWMSTVTDLDGRRRIRGGTVDMGAFEHYLSYRGTLIMIPIDPQ